MRQIKFRGLTKDTPRYRKWVYGYYLQIGNKHYICKTTLSDEEKLLMDLYFGYGDFCIGFIEVIPETVGQFIDRTDKNGKEIWENDIVRIIYKNHQFYGMIGKVIYNSLSASFWIHGNLGGSDWWTDEFVEKIGNVHENAEFLKESQ